MRWLFERCRDNGYIYKGGYTGQYCVNDELYINDAKPGDPCPECGRPTETVTEENYFFKLSAFQERLLELYRKDPEFVKPDHTAQRDHRVCAAGAQRSFHHPHQHQLGHSGAGGRPSRFLRLVRCADFLHERGEGDDDLWPADLHLIGKDILRFHAVYWPAFLMAADLPLPKKVFAHGWILFEENKMSKSRGNVVRPGPIVDVTGVDALRYFLLREITFGQDGSFSYDALIQRYNSDLANGLGNLASRTLSMIQQYRGGVIPNSDGLGEIGESSRQTTEIVLDAFNQFNFSKALEIIWAFISIDRQVHRGARAVEAGEGRRSPLSADAGRNAVHRGRGVADYLRLDLSGDAGVGEKDLAAARDAAADRRRFGSRICIGASCAAGQKVGKVSGVFPRSKRSRRSRRCRNWRMRRRRGRGRCSRRQTAGRRAALPDGSEDRD